MAEVRARVSVPVTANFAGLGAPSLCAPVVVNTSTGVIYTLISPDQVFAAGAGGTVTSIAQTFTGGLISVAGSPITVSGTLALTVAGTSGGIPYFSGATTWASSAALASNQLVIGGGAGVAPSTLGSLGTTVTVLHGNAAGVPSFAVVTPSDAAGNTNGSGNFVLTTSPALVTPTLGVASATSISFGNEALANYDEGTWTPTAANITGTNTYAGTYTRIGNRFLWEIIITTSTTIGTTAASSTLTLPGTSGTDNTCVMANRTTGAGYGTGLTTGNLAWVPTAAPAAGQSLVVSGQFKL